MQIKIFRTTALTADTPKPLNEDYSEFIKIEDSVYLLGYDTVNTERIN